MSSNSVQLADITIPKTSKVSEIVDFIRSYGVAVIPDYMNPSELKLIQAEFPKILTDEDKNYIHFVNYPVGKAVVVNLKKISNELYPAINRCFGSTFFSNIAKSYIGCPCHVNHGLYVTHEFRQNMEIAPTHFDKMWTLKFMLYVNDVGLDNGAFGVVPNTAKIARNRFRKMFVDNNLDVVDTRSPIYRKMNNSHIPGEIGPVVDIVGTAGTLIIFDTDTFHHAGVVKEGHERKILRAHSGPSIVYSHVFKKTRQWWRGEKCYSHFDERIDSLKEDAYKLKSRIKSYF